MYLLKAPSPDGMPPLFFQHFWSTMGDVVTKTILDFLNLGISPPNFNDTYIVFIPECKKPKRITDYKENVNCKRKGKKKKKVSGANDVAINVT